MTVVLLAIAGAVVALIVLRQSGPAPAAATDPAPAPSAAPERRITATLYYVSEDGMALVGVQREIPFGETVLEQAQQIVQAQLEPAPQPLVSAIPPGTTLRAMYVTERGEAFVDLSVEARTRHPGGALDELFTVYSIVDALTVNMPAILRVQILVEGSEVDTLAGHVDLRNPLQKNLQWVRSDTLP
ncbi:MAG TPA: GerMN domain-containing protein [Vicinamibacterales bacterium]|nr:GerMN domain-containing protein [Vicinamibacterales bacterium]